MSFSLYSATVPTYLQLVSAAENIMDKAAQHCAATGISEADLLGKRLAEDMLPLSFQLGSVCHHSKGAIEGLREGVFAPSRAPQPESFAEFKAKLAETREFLAALTEAEVNGFEGKPMRFEIGEMRIDFTAENFLTSFSLPNFFFHTTTAYDILRWQGVNLGKRDFMGQMRTA